MKWRETERDEYVYLNIKWIMYQGNQESLDLCLSLSLSLFRLREKKSNSNCAHKKSTLTDQGIASTLFIKASNIPITQDPFDRSVPFSVRSSSSNLFEFLKESKSVSISSIYKFLNRFDSFVKMEWYMNEKKGEKTTTTKCMIIITHIP